MEVCSINSGSDGNCHIVNHNDNYIILDCGLPFNQITHYEKFPKFKNIDFVFCSHCHKDHNKSLRDFENSGCEIISYETLEKKVQNFEIGVWNIKTFPIAHNVDNWGVIIKHKETKETLCYVTDFYSMPKIEGIDIWIYEVNYIDSLIDEIIEKDGELDHTGFNFHNSLGNAIEYFSSIKTRPKGIYCCHTSKHYGIKKKIKKEMKQFADNVVVL